MLIDISNHPVLSSIKRKVRVLGYTKSYEQETYTLPYVLEHYNEQGDKITGFGDYKYLLTANNAQRVYVLPDGTFSWEPVVNGVETGLYDHFQNLQKIVSDETIITAQIIRIDSEGRFNGYIINEDIV